MDLADRDPTPDEEKAAEGNDLPESVVEHERRWPSAAPTRRVRGASIDRRAPSGVGPAR